MAQSLNELGAAFDVDPAIPDFDHSLCNNSAEQLFCADSSQNPSDSVLHQGYGLSLVGSSEPCHSRGSDNSLTEALPPDIATSRLALANCEPTDVPHEITTSNQAINTDATMPPKTGKRFSSRSIKVLKTWFWEHSQHPYPTVGDVEIIERQTGLSKPQITTWFANARRRMKFQLPRTPVPSIDTPSRDVPRRCDSPAPFENMNPLQRWQNSPPESEPASVSAIARAVSGLSSDPNKHRPANSLYKASPASSAGTTSHSSGSSLSLAHSHTSRASLGSLGNIKKPTKRRRRRAHMERTKRHGVDSLSQACHPFQCTFCTETFKTKHNWERHEKSLHLSLEQWRCSPNGPTATNAESELVCVYCGQVDPDQDHLTKHNSEACQERLLDDRTFYRKDHLQQHLKLVHDVQFRKWPMDQWRCDNQEIRSRCGFCGLVLSTWADRVDHLAKHFKDGKTIADWQGDWGFEAPVLDMVENSMPPYLIHYERNSPWPFTTYQGLPETPTSAFELIQVELEYFAMNYSITQHSIPSDQELQYEACCIIFGSEMLSRDPATPPSSWLRDLLMSSKEITNQARIRPMKSAAKSRITHLKINGKDSIFEACNVEAQLREYAIVPKLLGLDVGDEELQHEACNIVRCMEALSPNPSEAFVRLLTGLIYDSSHWLAPFRRRADLPLLEGLPAPALTDNTQKQRVPVDDPKMSSALPSDGLLSIDPVVLSSNDLCRVAAGGSTPGSGPSDGVESATPFFLTDDNCYRRLARELSRFVAITTSTCNPNSNVPTDEELQHQARWIMFENDDPWNQTPADTADWLREFKRGVGLLHEDTLPDSSGNPANHDEETDGSNAFFSCPSQESLC